MLAGPAGGIKRRVGLAAVFGATAISPTRAVWVLVHECKMAGDEETCPTELGEGLGKRNKRYEDGGERREWGITSTRGI